MAEGMPQFTQTVRTLARSGGWPVAAAVLATAVILPACSPTVRVEAPTDPIEINLNVKIDQEVRVRIDRDLDQVFQENPDIF